MTKAPGALPYRCSGHIWRKETYTVPVEFRTPDHPTRSPISTLNNSFYKYTTYHVVPDGLVIKLKPFYVLNLYYIILHYITLMHCIASQNIISYHIISYIISYITSYIIYHIIYRIIYYIILYYIILYYIILYYIILYYIILYYIRRQITKKLRPGQVRLNSYAVVNMKHIRRWWDARKCVTGDCGMRWSTRCDVCSVRSTDRVYHTQNNVSGLLKLTERSIQVVRTVVWKK